MALTIQQQPPQNFNSKTFFLPSFAPIEYLVSSTNTAQAGFKVIVSVHYDTDGADTKIATLQLNTIPSATQVVTDIQNIVQSFVSSQYTILEGDTVDLSFSDYKNFRVAFQEYNASGLQGSPSSGATFYAWDAAPKYKEFATDDWKNWSINEISAGVVTGDFLSSFEQNNQWANFSKADKWIRINDSQKYQINWLIDDSRELAIYVKTMDAAFNTLSVRNLNFTSVKNQYGIDVGVQEITAHNWLINTTPSALDMTGVKYYALRILEATDDYWITPAIGFEVDDCDSTYTNYELHWLNRRGGFDSYTFTGKSNQETDIQKNFAKYNTRKIESSSIVHNTYAQRKRAFNTGLRDSYTLNSRLLRDFEITALEDLVSSPEVYWRDGSNFLSVNVTDKTYRHAKSENGQVYSMQLTMEIDNSDKRQW